MNWFWIDRFIRFESGRFAQAIKVISRAEDHLHDHFHFHSVMPMSLVIEGLAQTAGLLVHEAKNYEKKVVLGKIPHLELADVDLTPGDVLTYSAQIDYIHDDGAMLSVTVEKNGGSIGSGTLVFAHLGEDFSNKPLYGKDDLFDLFRCFGVYDIGVKEDGSPILDPKFH